MLDGNVLDARRRVGIQLPFADAEEVLDGREVPLFDVRVFPKLHPDEGVKVRSICLWLESSGPETLAVEVDDLLL